MTATTADEKYAGEKSAGTDASGSAGRRTPSADTIAQYTRLRDAFRQAVESFTGVPADHETLIDAASRIEAVVAEFARHAGVLPPDPAASPRSEDEHREHQTQIDEAMRRAEGRIAAAAGLRFDDGDYYERFDAGIRHILRLLHAASQRGHEAVLEELRNRGVPVNAPRVRMVDTEPAAIETGSGAGFTPPRLEPERIGWVVEAILGAGGSMRDFYADPSLPPHSSQMREVPYVLFTLPNYGPAGDNEQPTGLQILVCPQVGETTFLIRGMYDPAFFAPLKKDYLRAIPGIADLPHRGSHENWMAALTDFVRDGRVPERPAINIDAASRAARPREWRPTPAQIFDKIMEVWVAELNKTRQAAPDGKYTVPTFTRRCSDKIPGWNGRRWDAIDGWLRLRESSLSQLRNAGICNLARIWLEANPGASYEDLLKGRVPGYENVIFDNINQAMMNTPGKDKTFLAVILRRGDVIASDVPGYEDITPTLVFKKIMGVWLDELNQAKTRHPDTKGHIPSFATQTSGQIPGWNGRNWQSVDMLLRDHHDSSLSQLRNAGICDLAKTWFEANPGAPYEDMLKGRVPGYEDATFGELNRTMTNPHSNNKTSLARVLQNGDIMTSDIADCKVLTPHNIFTKMMELWIEKLEALKRSATVPPKVYKDANFFVRNKELIPGWEGRRWDAVDAWLNNHHDSNLSQLRNAGICNLARIWLEANPGASYEDLLKGRVPGYEVSSFDDVNRALMSGHSRNKTSLAILINKAGIMASDVPAREDLTSNMVFNKIMRIWLEDLGKAKAETTDGKYTAPTFITDENSVIPGWEGRSWASVRCYLSKTGDFSYVRLIESGICDMARTWRENNRNGSYEDMLDATLPGYEAATFRDIDGALRNKGSHKTSLDNILKAGSIDLSARRPPHPAGDNAPHRIL